jgi:hypothetical protein
VSPVDPTLPMRHTAAYRVRFDEATPRGLLRGSALLGYVQDVAWLHSEALGFPRAWYRERAWRLVRGVGVLVDRDGDAVTVTRADGLPQVARRARGGARRRSARDMTIDWAMTDGRVPVRIPAEFERAPIDGPGPFAPVRVDLPPTPPGAALIRFTPRLRELDPMNHANNGAYLDWLDEAVEAAGRGGDGCRRAIPRTYCPVPPACGGRGRPPRRHGRTAPPGVPPGRQRTDLLRGRLDLS